MTTFKLDDFGSFALEVEEKLHKALSLDDAFELNGARVYGHNAGKSLAYLETDKDVYELLEKKSLRNTVHLFDSAIIVTAGWGAPLKSDGTIDGAPSEHPQRRRVRLTIVVSDSIEDSDGIIASILRFADDADSPILDLGIATGALADAVNEFYYQSVNQ